ncbi:MAG: hypothetical protein J0H31_22320, partial [Alphaproteobacteria bacterium]|nr:hypothetical protein [Alphaproteobacteria bacterium]
MSVRAVTGTRVVLLAVRISEATRENLLGFAFGIVNNGQVNWLRGRKVFRSVIPNPDPKADFSTAEQPVQSLIWADYTATPGTKTTYRVAPVYGPVGALRVGPAIDIEVQTEDPEKGRHGIYFNRGAIASQAFSEDFQNKPPKDPDDPKDPTVRWLSRGMLDAALAFIKKAKAGDRLHVAAYEFTYTPILLALKDAAASGVDVQIVYEAGKGRDRKTGKIVDTSATTSARKAISALQLDSQKGLTLIKRTKRRNIPHNKFIVWVRGEKSAEVLAGSANFTASGFCGQTNVVHIVRDPTIADDYLAYWNELAQDPTTPDLSTWSQARTPQDQMTGLLSKPAVVPYFSPRKNDAMLSWYADRIAEAEETVMFTAAFGVNKLLAAQFGIDRPFVRFVLLEDEPDADLRAKLSQDRDVMSAFGSLLGAYTGKKKTFPVSDLDKWFLKEELYRKEGNIFFIHTKFLLTDPLSDNPLVCTGSANFSTSSLEANDENMFLIRGDTAVADIYLTEFDRIFRHFYARQEINRRLEKGLPVVEAKFLEEDNGWLDGYVKLGRLKTNRQRLFFPD